MPRCASTTSPPPGPSRSRPANHSGTSRRSSRTWVNTGRRAVMCRSPGQVRRVRSGRVAPRVRKGAGSALAEFRPCAPAIGQARCDWPRPQRRLRSVDGKCSGTAAGGWRQSWRDHRSGHDALHHGCRRAWTPVSRTASGALVGAARARPCCWPCSRTPGGMPGATPVGRRRRCAPGFASTPAVRVRSTQALAGARYALAAPLVCVRRRTGPWNPPLGVTFADWIAGAMPQPPVAVLAASLATDATVDAVLDRCEPAAGRWSEAPRRGLTAPVLDRTARMVLELACRSLDHTGRSPAAQDEVTTIVDRRLAGTGT